MKVLRWLILTWLGRLALSSVILVVFGILYDYYYQDWALYPVIAVLIYWVILFFYMMYWATKNTIGDIKDWWKNRKNK